MSLRLFNTRTREVAPFAPLAGDRVRMYVCGLTPSAEAHLGHARSFMFFDVVRRWLVYRGYRVEFVQNVTDIDDRSIAAALATGRDWREIVSGFHASFVRSMARLHVLEPDHEPHATAYVPQIVEMIAELIARDAAYAADDGVYFAVRSFPRYGALSGRSVDELLVGARIAPGEDKRDPLDFALWKFAKPGEPSWPSPWGDGRPGWHIECSAMSRALLGEPFDIHGGGFDLIFPHHENEIAQTESLAPPPMANVWMHGGLLLFDGKKMSKSLGNFEPLATVLDRHDPQAIRMLFLGTGYRKPMNFTEDAIAGATKGLRRLQAAYDALRAAPPADAPPSSERADAYRARFGAALDDDFNTAGALSVLFDVAANAGALAASPDASATAAFLHEAMTLVGIGPNERAAAHANASAPNHSARADAKAASAGSPGASDAPEILAAASALAERADLLDAPLDGDATDPQRVVQRFVDARSAAKAAKDFALADKLRGALTEAGIAVRDSKEGTTWSVAG